jgi:hypothetical protein
MAFTTVPTVVVGQLHTAAMWNTYVRDNANWYGTRKYVLARRVNTTVTLTNLTVIGPIVLDTEVVDTDGFFTAGSSTITIPTGLGGIYAVTISGSTAASFNATGALARIATTGGLSGIGATIDLPLVCDGGLLNGSYTSAFTAGATLQFLLYQNSGSNQTLNALTVAVMYLGL